MNGGLVPDELKLIRLVPYLKELGIAPCRGADDSYFKLSP